MIIWKTSLKKTKKKSDVQATVSELATAAIMKKHSVLAKGLGGDYMENKFKENPPKNCDIQATVSELATAASNKTLSGLPKGLAKDGMKKK